MIRKALFCSLSIFILSSADNEECHNGAAYYVQGLMNVVQILTKSCLDTLKAFNFDSMYNLALHFVMICLVFKFHLRSSLSMAPSRFTLCTTDNWESLIVRGGRVAGLSLNL